jgi:hypothetical protein
VVAETEYLGDVWVKCWLLDSRLRGLVPEASDGDQEWKGRAVQLNAMEGKVEVQGEDHTYVPRQHQYAGEYASRRKVPLQESMNKISVAGRSRPLPNAEHFFLVTDTFQTFQMPC